MQWFLKCIFFKVRVNSTFRLMNFICGQEKRDKSGFFYFRNQLSMCKMGQFRVYSLQIVPVIINYILLHVSVSISFMTLILEKLLKFLV